MLREHHQLDARTEARQLERRVQAVELRHADVHHGDIGVLATHQAHRLAAVGRLPRDHEPRALQQGLQSLSDEHVIVGEYQAYRHH